MPTFIPLDVAINGEVAQVDVNPDHVVCVLPAKVKLHYLRPGISDPTQNYRDSRQFLAAEVILSHGGRLYVVHENAPHGDAYDVAQLCDDTVSRLSGKGELL